MTAEARVDSFDLRARLRSFLPGVELGSVSTEHLTLAWVEGAKGASVLSHHHPQAQFTVVVTGRVRVTTPAGARELSAGQAILIPGGTPHAAEITADAVYLDIFHPARHDLDAAAPHDAKGS